MILQYIQNAGADGAKRNATLEYLQGTLPGRNTRDQNSDLIRNILREMGQDNIIVSKNRLWYLSKSTDYTCNCIHHGVINCVVCIFIV